MKWHTVVKCLKLNVLIFLSQCAQAEASAKTPVQPLSFDSISQLIFALIIVLCVIILAAWIMRRFNIVGVLTNPYIRVIASQNLGAREKLVLVKSGEVYLLLGVTGNQINTLHTFDSFEELPTNTGMPESFRDKLTQMMQGDKS